jgi:uncharacterized SAM-binding protein YcdF (DUF218 family)
MFNKNYHMKAHTRIFLIFLGVLILLSVVGNFLVVDQKPVKSDAVIVLSGDQGRMKEGIKLYYSNYARNVILSNALEDNMTKEAIRNGIPIKHLLLETSADSTYTNALYTYRLMTKYHLRSAIVVSSTYHMRRVKFNFDQVYKQSNIKLTYCAAHDQSFHPYFWWTSRFGIQTTFNEYLKLIGNAFGLNGPEAKKPLHKINSLLF